MIAGLWRVRYNGGENLVSFHRDGHAGPPRRQGAPRQDQEPAAGREDCLDFLERLEGDAMKCPTCEGTGKYKLPPTFNEVECGNCAGSGEVGDLEAIEAALKVGRARATKREAEAYAEAFAALERIRATLRTQGAK